LWLCAARPRAADLGNARLTFVPIWGTNVTIMGTFPAPSSLGMLLFGKTRLAVLSLFLLQPERRLHFREILRLTGAGQGAAQRELAKLAEAGILLKTREGNLAYYRANRAHLAFTELRGLVEKTAGISAFLRTALLPLAQKIEQAFLFGSVARGEERAESDIDLMVIGDVSFMAVVAAVAPLQESVGREINPTVFTASEFRKRLDQGDHFLSRVMQEDRVDLIGGEHEP